MSEEEQAKHIANLISNIIDLEKENERLHSIIKEVREYMEKQLELLPHYMYEAEMYKVLEILDKEGNNNE